MQHFASKLSQTRPITTTHLHPFQQRPTSESSSSIAENILHITATNPLPRRPPSVSSYDGAGDLPDFQTHISSLREYQQLPAPLNPFPGNLSEKPSAIFDLPDNRTLVILNIHNPHPSQEEPLDMANHVRTSSGLRAGALEFTPGSKPGAGVLATLGGQDEVPERWDDGLEDEEEEQGQETPVPAAPKMMRMMIQKKARRKSDMQRLSFSSPRTPDSRPRLASFTSPPLQTPVDAKLEAISNNSDLTKRQKKRQSKKYRNYLRDIIRDPEPEPQPKPQVFRPNEDDFPPLGTASLDTAKRVISSSVATKPASPSYNEILPNPVQKPGLYLPDNYCHDFVLKGRCKVELCPLVHDHAARREFASTAASTPVAILARPRRGTIPTGPALMSSPATSNHHKAGSSTSWVSSATGLKDKYERLAKNAGHFGLFDSPVFPQTVGEYAARMEDCQREKIAFEQTKIADKLQERESAKSRPDVLEIEVLAEEDGALVAETLRLGKGWGAAYEKYIGSGAKEELASTANPAEDFHALEPIRMRVEKAHFVRVVDDRAADDREQNSTIWNPNYVDKLRAAWPAQNELKAEGELRLRAWGKRRMPLPKYAKYTEAAFTAKFESGVSVEELMQHKGEDIAWHERELVKFVGVDSMKCIRQEEVSEEKNWDEDGYNPARRRPSLSASRAGVPKRVGSRSMVPMAVQSPAGSKNEMDELTRNFASMGSHGLGDQRWANVEAAEQRSVSGPAAYRTPGSGFTPKLNSRGSGTWTDRSYSPGLYPGSLANGLAHQSRRRTSKASNHTAPVQHRSPYTPQLGFAPYNPDDYEDAIDDEEEPPPGGHQFDEETLRRLGVADILDRM